jgi:hypothetical protein
MRLDFILTCLLIKIHIIYIDTDWGAFKICYYLSIRVNKVGYGRKNWGRSQNRINANNVGLRQTIDRHSPTVDIIYVCAAPSKILKVGGGYL